MARTLAQWLRERSDSELIELLRRRPDLGLPAPADITTLANRIAVRTSVQRAIDSLDAWRLRVLEALAISGDTTLLGPDDRGEIADALRDLREVALIWGDEPTLAPSVIEALGPYPAGLGRPADQLQRGPSVLSDPAVVERLIEACDADERAVLERLADGPPVGLVRDARIGLSAPDLPPPKRLIVRGLLMTIDAQSVELPREVGLAIRASRGGPPLGALVPTPPAIEVNDRAPAEADRVATTAVLDLLRHVDALADDWSHHPPAVLRTGGVGVRELRRTVRVLGVPEPDGALVIELAAAAGLIGATNGLDPTYLPTPEYDAWTGREPAERWVALASAWLTMTRQPNLVGQRDERERLITVLGPDAERGTVANLRRIVLDVLATLPPGAAPTSRTAVLARLAWQNPRRANAQRKSVEAVLSEADLLAVTSAGGLTSYGRAVLADAASAARDAVAIALPEPVDHVLVQPDLTVVVPGPPAADLARELSMAADLESVGGASVYRITEASIRRALDAGSSAASLRAMLMQRSRTPLPQGLTYLIDDIARRHGVLRTGTALSYLRSDDEALLARVVADRGTRGLGLRLIATTVAISSAPVAKVLEMLREAGFAPVAEAADGVVVSVADAAPRAPSRLGSRSGRARAANDVEAVAGELVRRIRAGDSLAERDRATAIERAREAVSGWEPGMPVPGVTSATTLGLLRGAIRAGQHIQLGYVDSEGQPSRHTILPISMAGGTLRGHDPASRRLDAFALHRITDVSVVSDPVG